MAHLGREANREICGGVMGQRMRIFRRLLGLEGCLWKDVICRERLEGYYDRMCLGVFNGGRRT